MIATSYANNILDKLLRAGKRNDGGTIHEVPKYLGFSTTAPAMDTDGTIKNFTEPDPSTGYHRLEMSKDQEAWLDPAANATIKNTTYNLAFPVPNKGQQYGSAKAIGFFENSTDEKPYFVADLNEEVTLGLKATLVIYKNDFSTTLTATGTVSA